MLTCREVEQLIGSDGIRSAGWIQRLSAGMHLTMCRHCSDYAKQIRAIGDAVRKVYGVQGDPETLSRLRRDIEGDTPANQ